MVNCETDQRQEIKKLTEKKKKKGLENNVGVRTL